MVSDSNLKKFQKSNNYDFISSLTFNSLVYLFNFNCLLTSYLPIIHWQQLFTRITMAFPTAFLPRLKLLLKTLLSSVKPRYGWVFINFYFKAKAPSPTNTYGNLELYPGGSIRDGKLKFLFFIFLPDGLTRKTFESCISPFRLIPTNKNLYSASKSTILSVLF